MITSQVDLGQIILGFIMTTMGWLIKRELSGIHDRLDKHDEVIMELVRDVSILIGRGGEVYEMSDKGLVYSPLGQNGSSYLIPYVD